MPLIVFGGGSAPSEVEASSVTITKPSGTDSVFRVYCTTVNGGKTEFKYRLMDSYNKRAVISVAKGSALTVVNGRSGSFAFDTVGNVGFVYSTGEENALWIFEVVGDGEINITE